MDERICVATLQYHIRQVETFDQFAAQVRGLVETAADYKCRLVLFPEYFTLQLLTLGDVRADIRQQVRRLAGFVDRYVALFRDGGGRRRGVLVVARLGIPRRAH